MMASHLFGKTLYVIFFCLNTLAYIANYSQEIKSLKSQLKSFSDLEILQILILKLYLNAKMVSSE